MRRTIVWKCRALPLSGGVASPAGGGRFDHIVSIERFEAVGEARWPDYFTPLWRCLRSGGRPALQVIIVDDARDDAYQRWHDFIQRYVFPGGMLPWVERFHQHAAKAGL